MKSTDLLRQVQDEINETAFSQADYAKKSDFFLKLSWLPDFSPDEKAAFERKAAYFKFMAERASPQ